MDLKEGAGSFNVLEVFIFKGVGTTKRTTKIADNDKKPVSIKIPGTPMRRFNTGAPIKDKAKVIPIVAPIMAIALVRCSSLVKSATSAVIAAEIAPAP